MGDVRGYDNYAIISLTSHVYHILLKLMRNYIKDKYRIL